MNLTLIRKSVREGLALFVACFAGLFAYTFFRVWIVGRLDSNRFKQIIDLLPKDWDRYSSVDFSWMISYLGRVAMTLDEPMIVMMAALWGIVRGSDVVSGELGRGTMEMLLAQPIRRATVYWSHVSVSIFGALLLALCVWTAMFVGVELTMIKETVYPELRIPFTDWAFPLTFREPTEQLVAMRDHLSGWQFWPGIVNLVCLMIFLFRSQPAFRHGIDIVGERWALLLAPIL
ncbi:MAG: ABC transporter permease subunit [Pirellulaceae bacterium]